MQELVDNTNRTHLNDLAKLTYPDLVSSLFYLKDKDVINVTQHLSSVKCEQFIVTKIAQLLFNKTRVDFATVSFHKSFRYWASIQLFEDRQFIFLNKLTNKAQEMPGYKFIPIPVDTMVQIQSIHEINLSEQYLK